MSPAIKFSGDLGDSIATLCVARNLHASCGELVTLLAADLDILREPFLPRLPLLRRLIEAQPYIKSLGEYRMETCHDLTRFRRYHSRVRPLAYGQTRAFNAKSGVELPMDFSPWLECESHSYSPGRICIARSQRYRNEYFNWKALIERFRDEVLFIGSRTEHADAEARFGRIEWVKTNDLYDAASLIAGARAFVGNQSAPLNIALGLGRPVICELNTFVSDVVLDRPDCQFSYDGSFTFDGIHFPPSGHFDPLQRNLVAERAIINSKLKF